jgi:prefoldin subunit 5
VLISDIEMYKARIVEIEQSLNYDMQNKIKNYEQRNLSLNQEIEELRSKLKESMERSRMIS